MNFISLNLLIESGNFTTSIFVLGILLFLVSIIIMVSPLRERLTVIQRIEGFGVNLQITVLTLLILISAGLLTSGIWLQLRNIGGQLEELRLAKEKSEKSAENYRLLYEAANKASGKMLLSLEGVDGKNKPNKESLTCLYETGGANEASCDVETKSKASNSVKITINNLQEDTTIARITLLEKDDKKRTWATKRGFIFQPLLPKVEMEEQPKE